MVIFNLVSMKADPVLEFSSHLHFVVEKRMELLQ